MPYPFHFAYHVTDLDESRAFYTGALGAVEGRSTDTWVDFDFYGHQLSLHLGAPFANAATGKVGDHMVPMPHFGIILPLDEWNKLAGRLEERQTDFILAPSVRFKGEPGEQWTMFFRDPSGNPIEVKGLAADADIFAK
ncbi:VOC family protein [Loktanella salsilacus]|uniref:VOC family protein n=1 Tax=Loktanella salsilacus TaxID=195913 RepID=UPI003002246B